MFEKLKFIDNLICELNNEFNCKFLLNGSNAIYWHIYKSFDFNTDFDFFANSFIDIKKLANLLISNYNAKIIKIREISLKCYINNLKFEFVENLNKIISIENQIFNFNNLKAFSIYDCIAFNQHAIYNKNRKKNNKDFILNSLLKLKAKQELFNYCYQQKFYD